jgi:hypothetical protein
MMSHHITYRDEFAKAPPKLCEVAGERERASILKGMAQCKPYKYEPNKQQSVMRKDSVRLAARVQGYHEEEAI